MQMGYRTPSQMQYAPSRFGAYAGGIMYNPNHMAGFTEFKNGYLNGLKSGSLTSYALPLGILAMGLPILMPKAKIYKNVKVKRAIQVGGLLASLTSLYMVYTETHPSKPAQ